MKICAKASDARPRKSFEPQRRHRHREGEEEPDRQRPDECERKRPAELIGEDHDRVGAYAIESDMAEGELTRDAEQKIEAERQSDGQQHLAEEVGGVVVEEEGRGNKEHRATKPRQRRPPRHRTAFGGSSPVGRTRRNRMRRSSGTPIA